MVFYFGDGFPGSHDPVEVLDIGGVIVLRTLDDDFQLDCIHIWFHRCLLHFRLAQNRMERPFGDVSVFVSCHNDRPSCTRFVKLVMITF